MHAWIVKRLAAAHLSKQEWIGAAVLLWLAQWWENLLPTDVSRIQIQTSASRVFWVCWLSDSTLRLLRFSPVLSS